MNSLFHNNYIISNSDRLDNKKISEGEGGRQAQMLQIQMEGFVQLYKNEKKL